MYNDVTPAITTAESVLDGVAGVRDQTRLLERGLVVLAVEWAKHNPTDPFPPGHPGYEGMEEQWVFDQMHHQGTITFNDSTVHEFALAAGFTEYTARKFIRESLMLVHFLPRVWSRVLAGGLDVWRAQQLAGDCFGLSRKTIDFIDRHMADHTARITAHTRQRIVAEARKRYMATEVAAEEEQARNARKVEVYAHMTQHGVTSIFAQLDHPDAVALDNALNIGAQAIKASGSDAPLDTRRAWALGDLARGVIREGGQTLASSAGGSADEFEEADRPHWDGSGIPAPQTTLFIHMPADEFTGDPPGCAPTGTEPSTGVARYVSAGMVGDVVIGASTIREWFTRPHAFGQDPPVLTVRPVLNLAEEKPSSGYVPPPRTKQHVRLLHDRCVFPFCTRSVQRCDLDHVEPWKPGGAGGATCSCNLAPLCRTHHRVKTHSDNASTSNGKHNAWSYVHLGGQEYYWSGPRKMQFVTNMWGTFNASAERHDGAPQHPEVPRLGMVEPMPVDLGDDVHTLAAEELIDALLTKASASREGHAKVYVPEWKIPDYPDPFDPPPGYPDDAEQQVGSITFTVDYDLQDTSTVMEFFHHVVPPPWERPVRAGTAS